MSESNAEERTGQLAHFTEVLEREERKQTTSSSIPMKARAQLKSTPQYDQSLSPSSGFVLSSSPMMGREFDEWSDTAIPEILRITLKPHGRSNRIYLPQLAQEYSKEGKSHDRFDDDSVDRILLCVLSKSKFVYYESVVDYLIACYKTGVEERKRLIVKPNLMRVNLLEYILSEIVSYLCLIFRFPEKFPQTKEEIGTNLILSRITGDVHGVQMIPDELLSRIVEKYRDDGLEQVFEPVFEELMTRALSNTKISSWRGSMHALTTLTKNKVLASLLVQMSHWVPSIRNSGKEMEVNSILGPFFRMAVIPRDIHHDVDRELFSELGKEVNDSEEIIQYFKSHLNYVQDGCYTTLLTLLKSSRGNREYVMKWISETINRNKNRIRMDVDKLIICGDGFLVNFTLTLLQLCEPFLETESKQIAMIDPNYYITSDRIVVDNSTCICMTTEEFNSYAAELKKIPQQKDKSLFVTEIFWSTLQAFQIGVFRLLQVIDHTLQSSMTVRVATKATLLDKKLLTLCFKYFNFLAAFLLRTALGGKTSTPNTLPLPDEVPKAFASLPEFCFESIAEFMLFVVIHAFDIIDHVSLDTMVTFLTTFTSSPHYIKNPHLRIKLVETLGFFCSPKRPLKVDPFIVCELAGRHLAAGLVHFYVNMECTGASTQFYDKFHARHYVALILQHLWKIESYGISFKSIFMSDASISLQFGNMLMNDSIYLLDETLSGLKKIHDYEQDKISGVWASLDLNQREDIQQQVLQAEKVVRTCVLFSSECIQILHYITKDITEFFMRTELCSRLAQMLNYFFVRLAGPTYKELNVQNPEKYKFKPKWLIKNIASIYLHFIKHSDFIHAVAIDGRSWNKEVFESAGALLLRTRSIDDHFHGEFVAFIEAVSVEAEKEKVEEEELGEVPDEFLDPILSTLMHNPVTLPSSGVTVDLSTITRHLLSSETDPFNRMPLQQDQLIPNNELKKKIQEWISSKLNAT